ncbi:MAG: alpha/beta fold hydrolase [Actinomycetes bacterium]
MSTPPFLELPASTRAYALRTSRGAYAVLDTGPAADVAPGPTAVLVPGFTGSKEDFIAVLEPLSAAGHRVVALDQRGQFETGGPGDPTAYAVEALALDLRAVLDALDEEPGHLVGHSFGGLVARAAVLADPGLCRSLTLLSSGPAAVSGPPADRLALLAPVVHEHGVEGLWQALRALDRANGIVVDEPPHIAEFLQRRFTANTPAGLVGMADALLHEPDRVDALAALALPVLVAHGPLDDVWEPGVQQAMADRLGARHETVAGATHSPAAENPQGTVNALLGFWASCDRDVPAEGGARA